MDDHAAVVEPSAAAERRADHEGAGDLAAGLCEFIQRGLDRIEQHRLMVQIVDGVGADAEFGEDEKACALCICAAHEL